MGIRKSSLFVLRLVIATVSTPAVATLFSVGAKAIARTPPLCIEGEKVSRLPKFQTATCPASEPVTSQTPLGLSPETFGRLGIHRAELILPVLGSKTGIFPSS